MVRPPRSTADPSLGHGVQEGRVRSSIIPPWVAALLLFASATAADAGTFVLRYDAIGSTGGYVGGTLLGMTAGQPVIGRATAAGGSIIETVGFWHQYRGTVM